jgi:NitT/TauT family transport system permease protein
MLNFFPLSFRPLRWIPFAILWFHIGDKPAIFLHLHGHFFPSYVWPLWFAVANDSPSIYFRVAHDYHYHGIETH